MKKDSVWAQLPKAADAESWVLVWKEPEIRTQLSDWAPPKLVKRGSITLIKAVTGNFSPLGLGTVELVMSSLLDNADHGALAGALAGCPHLGRGASLDRGAMYALVQNVPDKAAVKEALGIEKALGALYGLNNTTKLHEKRAHQDPRFLHSIIIPEGALADGSDYGLAYVPKGMADGLKMVERGHMFSETHVLCDLLGQKHQLFRQLGFEEAIALDLRLINNKAEAEATRALRGRVA